VADRDISWKRLQFAFRNGLRNQPGALVKPAAARFGSVYGDNARGLLATVLQRVQAEKGSTRSVRNSGDGNNPTHQKALF
jgi:hypothetical protein